MEHYDFEELDPQGRQPKLVPRSQWGSRTDLWAGALEGKTLGTGVTVLFYATEEIGEGPRWHVHPYDEVFIVRTGRALFTIGDQKIEADTGDVLMGPANIPHKYHNLGPGKLETTDIHVSDRWIQTNLKDPELE
ncbi:mannose-6-phosphate isomerase-like protein (cupin superfamily) [Rhodopirellula rubra]|uniref:Mannose-6-phosphate isomerase-like protein (Cupin superfamily) n=1 Tax=Aporhodopirellula rubra TaxID=980271 RepID=A0A7W5E527_9BACT|nr:cupin domain-containing protein [Aporhodopirellula rubra]MBB3210346.1 mannose-6-phosphate isomerase-like protein (cupin superfamily) [Aporhodopirellula rubra]